MLLSSTLPDCLAKNLPIKEGQSHDALAASAICGVVEDLRACVDEATFLDLLKQLDETSSQAIRETRAKGQHKLGATRIAPYAQEVRVSSQDHEPDNFQIPHQGLKRGLGGGAYNSLIDSAIIVKNLLEGETHPQLDTPQSHIAFPAIDSLRDSVAQSIKQAGVANLHVTQLKGTTRRSVFVTTKQREDQVSFSTSQAQIETTSDEYPKVENPRYVMVNNEPPESDTFQQIIRAREKKEGERPQAVIWSVGSNQIKEGITNFVSFLAQCDTVILNLDEAVDWIRSHLSRDIYNDKALVDLLEDPSAKEIKQVTESRKKIMQVIMEYLPYARSTENISIDNNRSDKAIKRVPQNKEKRQIIAQRCADLLHKLGFKGNVFITDGDSPTVISRKRKNSEGGISKRQYAIPILPKKRGQEIDTIIQTYGAEAVQDPTGCGDSVAASILALKQVSNNKVKPTTIAIVANHISALLYRMPYSNLLEIEVNHPGITRKIIDLALENMDEIDSLLYKNHEIARIDEADKSERSSPFAHMTDPS